MLLSYALLALPTTPLLLSLVGIGKHFVLTNANALERKS